MKISCKDQTYIIIGAIFALALYISGSVMIWHSIQGKVCDKWSTITPYNNQYCGPRGTINQALVDCNSTYLCACRTVDTFQIACLNMPSESYSPSFMGIGISMIIVGFVGTAMLAFYIKIVTN